MKKQIFIFLTGLIVFFLLNFQAFAQTDSFNAGFVKGIWYSKIPFFAGEDVRIYVAIQNRSGFDIIGKVQFYNFDSLIGQSDFSVLDGRLAEVWVDWLAVEGQQKISAKITEAEKSEAGKSPEAINLVSYSFPEDNIFVDIDTDGDKIGNKDDIDDDNDGLTDETEKSLGRDPLVAETESATDDLEESSADIFFSEEDNLIDKGISVYKKIEETVSPSLKKIAGAINEISDQQNEKINERRQQIKIEREASQEGKTLKNIEFFSLAIISFFLSNKILLYLALFFLLFVVIKTIIKFFRRNH